MTLILNLLAHILIKSQQSVPLDTLEMILQVQLNAKRFEGMQSGSELRSEMMETQITETDETVHALLSRLHGFDQEDHPLPKILAPFDLQVIIKTMQ